MKPPPIQITKRMPLYVGTRCNCECKFCYYINSLQAEMVPYDLIIDQLQTYRSLGMEAVDFTGGEPTIHKDIVRLVRDAASMGFKRMGLITNGLSLRRVALLDDLISAGIEIFNLSIHGHNAELHDGLTGRRGSFDNMMKLISILEERGISFGVNMVVNVHNYRHLVEYAEMISGFKAEHGVTFLVMSPLNEASRYFDSLSARHSEIAVYMKQAVALLREREFPASWKFMPLCVAPECADRSMGFQQFFLTPYDWNQKVTYLLTHGRLRYYQAFLKNFSRFNKKQLSGVPFEVLAYQAVLDEILAPNFEKPEQCAGCKYFHVCDGQSKAYRRVFGSDEIRAIPGEQVVNPMDVLGQGVGVRMLDRVANHGVAALGKPLHRAIEHVSGLLQMVAAGPRAGQR